MDPLTNYLDTFIYIVKPKVVDCAVVWQKTKKYGPRRLRHGDDSDPYNYLHL
jgi:hypothetical protein